MKQQLDEITSEQLQGLQRVVQLSDESRLIKSGLCLFLSAFRHYQRRGYICQSIHQQLIDLYCRTNGSLYHSIQHLMGIPPLESQSGNEHVDTLLSQLKQDGYTQANQILTSDECDYILTTSMQMPGHALMADGNYRHLEQSGCHLDHHKPVLVNIGLPALTSDARIKQLLTQSTALQEVIKRMFAYETKIVSGRLCLSYPTIGSLKDEAAQSWHFDLDGIGFVKQFIYLNHVDHSNGHHCYIPGTHRPGSKSELLLKRRYSRISDLDMQAHQPGAPVYVEGRAGTGFLGSTLCWHKGGTVSSGFRAMFIIEYSVSRFQLDVKPCRSDRLKHKLRRVLSLLNF